MVFLPSDIGAMYEIDNYLNEAMMSMRKAGKKVDEVQELLINSGLEKEGNELSTVRGMIDGSSVVLAEKIEIIKGELNKNRRNVLKLLEVV